MKVLMIGVAALLVGVGAGSFVSGNKVKNQLLEEAAAEAAAHEVEAGEAVANGAEGGTDGDPDGHTGDGDTTHEPDSGGGVTPDSTAAGEGPIEQGAPNDGQDPAEGGVEGGDPGGDGSDEGGLDESGARKLAKIFGAMQAQDAADVLQQMSDEEIERILAHMNDRMAAQVLGVFDPTRAAALSRAVLGATGGGQ